MRFPLKKTQTLIGSNISMRSTVTRIKDESQWGGFRLQVLVYSILFLSTVICTLSTVRADEIEDLQKQINELSSAREQSVAATKPLEGQLSSLKRQLAQIQTSLDNLSSNIKKKQKELDSREEKLVKQQVILEERVRSYYKRSYFANPILVILSSSHSGELFRELSYRQTVAMEDKNIITSVTSEVLDLLTQKEKLQNCQNKTQYSLFSID